MIKKIHYIHINKFVTFVFLDNTMAKSKMTNNELQKNYTEN